MTRLMPCSVAHRMNRLEALGQLFPWQAAFQVCGTNSRQVSFDGAVCDTIVCEVARESGEGPVRCRERLFPLWFVLLDVAQIPFGSGVVRLFPM
eukprot:1641005-Pyramimonas_sp.AAC.1